MPIGAGKGQIKSVKIGAADDAALYPQYCDYILRMIALAFQLSARDLNIQEKDNRATAGAAADATFANAVLPLAKSVFEALESEVVAFFFPGYRLIVDYSEPRGLAAKEASTISKFKEGITKRNEAREELGNDPLDESDNQFANTGASGAAIVPLK